MQTPEPTWFNPDNIEMAFDAVAQATVDGYALFSDYEFFATIWLFINIMLVVTAMMALSHHIRRLGSKE
jgi:hypothetical protein